MADESDEQSRSFKVEDRRRFSKSGEPREPTAASEKPDPESSESREAEPPREEARGKGSEEAEPAAEINFATFVLSLSTQALSLLGEIPNPVDQTRNVDLPQARQIIDILAMLSEKTQGNLDGTEAALLKNALYDLRMRYVEHSGPNK